MILKDASVNPTGLHPRLIEALFHADRAYRDIRGHEVVITSLNDHPGRGRSGHYLGTAADLRTWTTMTSGQQLNDAERFELRAEILRLVGPDFVLIDEQNHFHLQFRPFVPGALQGNATNETSKTDSVGIAAGAPAAVSLHDESCKH